MKFNSATTSADDSPGAASPVRTLVLLCTYNEAANLPRVFELLGQHLPTAEILVVDDNSPDGTAQVVDDLRAASSDRGPMVHLLRREGKLGLGTAIRDGLLWCLERDYDFVICMDADLSHNPTAAPQLLAVCTQVDTAVDVAVGSRYVPGGGFDGLAWHRRFISRALNGYATRLLRLPVKDCSGSYRCYRTATLRKLDFNQLTCVGYGFLEELLVALYRRGAVLVEVPIRFQNRTEGYSKLGLRDIWGAIRVIHRLAIRNN